MVSVARWLWRVPFLGVTALALGSCCSEPDWNRLEASGNDIIRAIEDFRSAHGAYPSSLEAAGAHAAKTQWGDWKYMLNFGEGFFLSVGDYGEIVSSYTTALSRMDTQLVRDKSSDQSMKPVPSLKLR
jgi:hypothetical protein